MSSASRPNQKKKKKVHTASRPRFFIKRTRYLVYANMSRRFNPFTATWGQWRYRYGQRTGRGVNRYQGANPYGYARRINTRVRKLERGVTGKETKFHTDTSQVQSYTIVNTGFVFYMNGIAQGDTAGNREGLKCNIKSIWLKGYIRTPETQDNATRVRMIVFIDKQCNGSKPLVNGVGGLLETADTNAFREHQNPYRFRILYDRHLDVTRTTETDASGGISKQKMFKFYKKFKKGLRVRYTDASSAIGDAGGNGIFLLLMSNVATNQPVITADWRLAFTD